MHHVFISPHLDDAVLSCGELIYTFRKRSDQVSVITIFTGSPKEEELSEAAKEFHAECFQKSDAMACRKNEDRDAAKLLDYNCIHLNIYEALYRRDAAGELLYPTMDAIFSRLSEKDERTMGDLIRYFAKFFSGGWADHIYAPSGFGGHVDHLLTRKTFETLLDDSKLQANKLLFYEDIPYICRIDEKKRYESSKSRNLNPELISVSVEAWEEKVEAIRCYSSQLKILWKNEIERMAQLKEVSVQYTGEPAVRLWSYA